jgi:hypothetical protein
MHPWQAMERGLESIPAYGDGAAYGEGAAHEEMEDPWTRTIS